MEPNLERKIEETVLEILEKADMEEMTEHKVRKAASEKLGVDLSVPEHKLFVRQVVESFLREHKANAAAPAPAPAEEEKEVAGEEEEVEEEEEQARRGSKRGSDGKEYDDEGGLIVCRLSEKRRVTITEFRGKTLVSIREYYKKDGKELPSSKGISLTAEQWGVFEKNVAGIEKAIDKLESRN